MTLCVMVGGYSLKYELALIEPANAKKHLPVDEQVFCAKASDGVGGCCFALDPGQVIGAFGPRLEACFLDHG